MKTANSNKNPKKRSRDDEQDETKAAAEAVSQLLPPIVLIMARDGWLQAPDVCALEATCHASKMEWCTDEGVWKPLAWHEWPHVKMEQARGAAAAAATTTSVTVAPGVQAPSYKAVFFEPRLWLTAQAEHVRALAKWSEIIHFDVECGRCGCNCGEHGDCPGIPIRGEFRWEKKDQQNFLLRLCDRESVPRGLGYKMSGGTLIRILRFCEPCFDRLVKESILDPQDYKKVRGTTLFDVVTKEIIEATTERQNDENRHRDCMRNLNTRYTYYVPFFASKQEFSWQRLNNKVQADDIAFVVANALIQQGCQTRHLQLDGIHFNDPGFGPKGYKALALALSINTTVQHIDFFHQWDVEDCCASDNGRSYAADKSNGFFLKALEHNKKSALKKLPNLCPAAFGPHTWKAWQEVKPDLQCGPELYAECYHDIYDYLSEEEDDY